MTSMDLDQYNTLPYDSYPVEIFDKIAYYLTNKQCGICRTVCRSWNKLFTPSQYRHVQIRGRRQFNDIYYSLASDNVGHYVRRLSVEDADIDSRELESLPTLCPNLVAFSFNGKSTKSSSVNTFAEWKHLRRLTELQDLTVASYLLSAPSSSFSLLTHLAIRFEPTHNKHDFLASLYKATELINLSLDSVTLSFAEIESIHQSCPFLQKLRLINATLEPIATTIDEKRSVAAWSLEPARFMKTFEYENGEDLYDTYEWMYYISSKYPNLETLELWCAYSVQDPPERIATDTELKERYGALANIGMSCRFLKSLDILNITMNHWIFEAMDHVGTQLEHLGISDMTDNTIDILQYLSQSQQNVSSLTLWGWSTLCIWGIMEETVALLGQCSDRLSSLTFSMKFSGIMNAPVPLDLLLDQCPHLTELTFDSSQPSFSTPIEALKEMKMVGHFLRPQLLHLRLENGSFRNDFFEYISIRCPDLKKLVIESCTLIAPGTSDFQLKIHMPYHRFDLMSINHVRPPSNYHHAKKASDIRFYSVSVAGRRQQLYELTDFEPYSPSLTFDYEQKPEETTRPTKYVRHDSTAEVSPTTYVSIECQQIKELTIGNFWVN